MTDSKKKETTQNDKTQNSGFDCCSANFEEMFKKMQAFCGTTEKSSGCCAMMKRISGIDFEKPKK